MQSAWPSCFAPGCRGPQLSWKGPPKSQARPLQKTEVHQHPLLRPEQLSATQEGDTLESGSLGDRRCSSALLGGGSSKDPVRQLGPGAQPGADCSLCRALGAVRSLSVHSKQLWEEPLACFSAEHVRISLRVQGCRSRERGAQELGVLRGLSRTRHCFLSC